MKEGDKNIIPIEVRNVNLLIEVSLDRKDKQSLLDNHKELLEKLSKAFGGDISVDDIALLSLGEVKSIKMSGGETEVVTPSKVITPSPQSLPPSLRGNPPIQEMTPEDLGNYVPKSRSLKNSQLRCIDEETLRDYLFNPWKLNPDDKEPILAYLNAKCPSSPVAGGSPFTEDEIPF